MYDDLEQYTTKLIYIYGRCQYIQCSLWLEILPLQRGGRIAELELHLLMVRIVQQFDISCPPEAENVELFMRGVFNYDNESSFHVTQFTLHCNAVLSSKWDKF